METPTFEQSERMSFPGGLAIRRRRAARRRASHPGSLQSNHLPDADQRTLQRLDVPEPRAKRIACGTGAATANGSALDTETRWRARAATTRSARTSAARGIQMKYEEGCRTRGSSRNISAASACRRTASLRFSVSRRVTAPSSTQPQTIAVMTPGVFQVVERIARSSRGIQVRGAATKPTRMPVPRGPPFTTWRPSGKRKNTSVVRCETSADISCPRLGRPARRDGYSALRSCRNQGRGRLGCNRRQRLRLVQPVLGLKALEKFLRARHSLCLQCRKGKVPLGQNDIELDGLRMPVSQYPVLDLNAQPVLFRTHDGGFDAVSYHFNCRHGCRLLVCRFHNPSGLTSARLSADAAC